MKTAVSFFLSIFLFTTFLILKLAGVTTWSWAWVFAPLWLPLLIVVVMTIIAMLLAVLIK